MSGISQNATLIKIKAAIEELKDNESQTLPILKRIRDLIRTFKVKNHETDVSSHGHMYRQEVIWRFQQRNRIVIEVIDNLITYMNQISTMSWIKDSISSGSSTAAFLNHTHQVSGINFITQWILLYILFSSRFKNGFHSLSLFYALANFG